LFLALRRWANRAIRKVVPESKHVELERGRKIITWIVVSIGGIFIALAVAAVIISNLGVDVTPALQAVGSWFLEHGVRLLIIIGIGYLFYRLIKAVLPNIIERSITARGRGRRAKEEVHKRAQTLSRLFTETITILIVIVAAFMILSEVGIDIGPLLAGAGIAGIAVGFGAQHLIKDLINGVFILIEDQYNVGDVVKIAGIAGIVVGINLRRTILRDLDGIMHSVPNGEITTASNYTKEWSRVNLDVPVAYGEDLDHCFEVINRVGNELAKDKEFGPKIIEAPQVLRVNNFGDSGIDIKILGSTRPLQQWAVTGELRKRLKKAFDEEGIEIPWPHVKLYFGESEVSKDQICKSCLRPNLQGSKFCSNCGAELTKD